MAYSDKLLSHYMTLITRPVSAQGYAGEDVRFSSHFEALEEELAKARSMHGAAPVDWSKVREGAETILESLSKDLRVACWLAWALYRTESFPGLLAGCAMVDYLCREQWSCVFPVKSGTRGAALGWLVARLGKALAEDVPVKDQLPLFQALEGHLASLDKALIHKFKDDAPLLLPLRRRLAAMIDQARKVESPPPSLVEQVKQAAARLVAPVTVIESEKDARTALKAQQDTAKPLCAWWLRNKSSDLRALRLNRAVTWLAIEKLPECNAEHMTSLRGVGVEEIAGYQARLRQGHYADLIVDLEGCLAQAPFWLDGQHMVWECLMGLNADAAMQEVETHLARFIARFPAIVQLRFQDGRPFAGPATQAWIDTQVMPHIPAEPQAEPVRETCTTPEWEVALADAMHELSSKGLKVASRRFTDPIRTAGSERARFYWRLGLARLCHHAKNHELARHQLEALDEQIKDSVLARWEPELYLQILQLLHSCCQSLPQSTVVREYQDQIYRRLCHLDIEAVLA
jgi:type VI secretion system protein VasJ